MFVEYGWCDLLRGIRDGIVEYGWGDLSRGIRDVC